jgi:hypothetical protein
VTADYFLLPFFRRRFQGIDQATDGPGAACKVVLLPSPVVKLFCHIELDPHLPDAA